MQFFVGQRAAVINNRGVVRVAAGCNAEETSWKEVPTVDGIQCLSSSAGSHRAEDASLRHRCESENEVRGSSRSFAHLIENRGLWIRCHSHSFSVVHVLWSSERPNQAKPHR